MASDAYSRFCRSIDDVGGVVACFRENGVVAITGILTATECTDTLADMALPAGTSVLDPTTYAEMDSELNRFGVIGHKSLFTATLLRNRCHPNVVRAYELLYGHDDLLAQHDRVAVMRPYYSASGVEQPVHDTPFSYPGVHLDVNVPSFVSDDGYDAEITAFLQRLTYADDRDFTSENNAKHVSWGQHIQGVLNLIDNREEDGGFQCVPMADCGAWLREWGKTVKGPREPNGKFVFDAKTFGKLGFVAERVPCPAGTLICFDAALPHGTQPNRSDRPRAIQFLRYIPRLALPAETRKQRAAAIARHCAKLRFDVADPLRARVLFGSKP
jgi:ectoine hydroxylase-related dioxygenase (phytanoyl-CoA dioxygenase family)